MGGIPTSAFVETFRRRIHRLPLSDRPQDHNHVHGCRLVRPHRSRSVSPEKTFKKSEIQVELK
jgi:hypothetical protein